MIVGFVGTPGSGKTYEAVKKIIFNLKKRRRVYTNIDGMDDPGHQEFIKNMVGMDDFEFDKYFHFLTKDEVQRFWTIVKHGSFIVLDEIHKVFNCRDWQSKKNNEFADWASTHRHYGFDLVLITQDMEKVEKQVRSLLEWSYVFRKINFFGSAVQKKYICYSFSGDETHGKPLAQNVRTYQQPFFLCYKSYATKDAKEVGFMKHVNVLKHPVFIALPIVLAISLYLLFGKSSLASGDLFGKNKIKQKHQQIISNSHAKDAARTGKIASSALPVQKRYSSPALPVKTVPEWQRYEIEGFVKNDQGKTVLLVNGIKVLLPNDNVKGINLDGKFCEGKSSYFGEKRDKFSQFAPAVL